MQRHWYGDQNITDEDGVEGGKQVDCRVNHDLVARYRARNHLTALECAARGKRHFELIKFMDARAAKRRRPSCSS